ncbi:MAG TPA: DUF2723 domain-containing protein, partial [Gemmatimonadales bacterium]
MTQTSRPNIGATERPPYAVAAVVSLAVLALYLATLAPTTQFWDTSEYMSAAKVLGIPHPPGNPLFVVLAHVFAILPLAASFAERLNLFAAVTSAASSGLLFLVADRFLREFVKPKGPRLLAAFAGIVVGAASFTVWNQSVVNEKVYTLSLFSTALVLWLAVHWGDDQPGPHRDRWLLLIGYLLALTSTNHMMGVLAAPAVAVYVVATDWTYLTKPWVLLLGFALLLAVSGTWTTVIDGPAEMRGLVIIGFLAILGYAAWREPAEFRKPTFYAVLLTIAVGVSLNYIFLPLRAAHYPPINEGEPTTWRALQDVLNRVQYQKPPLGQRQADFISQLGNYLQYYQWQFGRDFGGAVAGAMGGLFGALGLLGAYRQWRSDRRGAFAMTAMMFTVTIALIYYLNFKYGFSYGAGREVAREVRERDYFFVASFLLWGVWVALGFGTLLEMGAEFLEQRSTGDNRWYALSPILLIAVIPIWGNHLTASRKGETLARDWAVDLLESVEPYSILFTAGDNDTFPLWYAQEVEGVRKDVLLVNESLAGTDWHLRQVQRRPIYDFDEQHAALPYRGKHWPKPSGEPFRLTMDEIDAIPGIYPLAQPMQMTIGTIKAIIDSGYLERADLAALQLVHDNIEKRPIYFSRTTADWPERIGLSPYMLTQGFARRVMLNPVSEVKGAIEGDPGVGWVDMHRTQDLLFGVYHANSAGRERPRGWIDTPSEGIMTLYGLVYEAYERMNRDTTFVGDTRVPRQGPRPD